VTDPQEKYSAFISYASEDRDAAFEACDRLEEAGLRCWIAPRDVRTGQDYGAEIIHGIEGSNAFVLVLSHHSNNSKFVKAEVERAYSKGKTVFPVRIEDVAPEVHLELFVSSSHWTDVFQGRLDDHFEVLAKEIWALGAKNGAIPPEAPGKPVKRSKLGRSAVPPTAVAATAVVAVAAIGLLIWQVMVGPDEPSGADAPPKSVAVLPFINMSSDPEQEYFSDGITEELLNTLAKIDGLQVAARTSAFFYKGKNRDVRAIGRELGVSNIVEGSVRRAGDDLRITSQLIRVEDGFHLWSETFDRELADIFSLQEEIAVAISSALTVSLGFAKGDGLVSNRTNDMVAYETFLRARSMQKQRGESLSGAIELYRAVLQRDPEFAPAWAGLAQSYLLAPAYLVEFADPIESAAMQARGKVAALRALYYDPENALASAALGNYYRAQFNWAEAERAYQAALEIDPHSSEILEDFSQFLQYVGRLSQAEEVARRAVELDPGMPFIRNMLSTALIYSGKFSEAREVAERTLAIDPGYKFPRFSMIISYLAEERFDDALAYTTERPELLREFSELELRQIRWLANPKGDDPPIDDALNAYTQFVLIRAGELDRLFTMIRRGQGLRSWEFTKAFEAPLFPYRADPRFKEVLLGLRLPEYWRTSGNWPDMCRPLGDEDFQCS
jgi:TolB-like protein/Flp pilus assembly protein TadD